MRCTDVLPDDLREAARIAKEMASQYTEKDPSKPVSVVQDILSNLAFFLKLFNSELSPSFPLFSFFTMSACKRA